MLSSQGAGSSLDVLSVLVMEKVSLIEWDLIHGDTISRSVDHVKTQILQLRHSKEFLCPAAAKQWSDRRNNHPVCHSQRDALSFSMMSFLFSGLLCQQGVPLMQLFFLCCRWLCAPCAGFTSTHF